MPNLFYVRLLAGCVILVALFLQVGVSEAVVALSEARPSLVVAALLLNLPILVLATLRSAILLRNRGYRPPTNILFSAVTLGFAIGGLTPAAAGELLRVEALNKHAGVPRKASLTLVLFERLLSFYLLCLTVGIMASILLLPGYQAAPLVLLLLAASFLPAHAGKVALLPLPDDSKTGLLARGRRLIQGTAADVEAITRAGLSVPYVAGITAAIFGLAALQILLLGRAVGAEIGLGVALFGFSFSQVAGIVSMLPVGVSDGLLTAVLTESAVSAQSAIAVALLVRITSLPMLLVAFFTHVHLTLRELNLQAAHTLSMRGPTTDNTSMD